MTKKKPTKHIVIHKSKEKRFLQQSERVIATLKNDIAKRDHALRVAEVAMKIGKVCKTSDAVPLENLILKIFEESYKTNKEAHIAVIILILKSKIKHTDEALELIAKCK